MQLDELNFTDELVLPSHTHQQMQMKTTSEAAAVTSASVSLNIYNGCCEILKYYTQNIKPITLDGETVGELETLMYQGSIIDEREGLAE
ncbi:unnamed protein product [Schistosoma margrebowiei]|uniref:Uncharacterized protein n=1 Tax=Schistosoma margrebowiei TaxID=48269 RepID=A0A183LID0_9TREM|nr:unnamed protein product [Schistosoma margrebowiei]